MRNFATDADLRLSCRLSKERGDFAIGGGDDTAHRNYLAGDSILSQQDRKIRYLVDTLKTMIGNQREVVIVRQGSQHLPDQLIRQLGYSVRILLERAPVMLLGIEVDQMDENEIRLLPLQHREHG